MGIIHGLVVILIFEGIIIQCECDTNATSATKLQDLTFPMIKDIFKRTVTYRAVGSVKKLVLMERKLTVKITPDKFPDEASEIKNENGDLVLEFESYKSLLSFFGKHGKEVSKIILHYHGEISDTTSDEVHQNIIRMYAQYFRELQISSGYHRDIWREINGENDIIFPNVEKFEFHGSCGRTQFKLNLIFPKLKSIALFGVIADENCLADVTGLEKLTLDTSTIPEYRLKSIFSKNKEMTKLCLWNARRSETMKSLAKTLKNLQSLGMVFPDKAFFYRSATRKIGHRLLLVTDLSIRFTHLDRIVGEPSFEVPNLKRLVLRVERFFDKCDEEALKKFHFFENSEKLESFQFIIGEPVLPKIVQRVVSFFETKKWLLTLEDEKQGNKILTFQRDN